MRAQLPENVEVLDPSRITTAAVTTPKRASFSGTPRSYTFVRKEHQPQDGCDVRGTDFEVAQKQQPILGEPEDARITGGTRSLMRRLSGLNTLRKTVRPVTLTLQEQVFMSCAKGA